jgi:uncharacterized protein with PQ loop repeat
MSTYELIDQCPEDIKAGWIYKIFKDCPSDTLKHIGFWVGVASLMLWIVLAIPQVIENFKNKKADGISIYLLLLWLFGDTCNLAGTILSRATPLMKIIAGYYIIYDVVLLSQLLYYGYCAYCDLHREGYYRNGYFYGGQRDGEQGEHQYGPRRHDSFWADWFCILFMIYLFTAMSAADCASVTGEGSSQVASETAGFWGQVFVDARQTIGFSLGVVMGVCEIAALIAQICLNSSRKSCKGVSVLMFILLFFALVTYNASVLLQSTGWVYIVQKSPWIISYAVGAVMDLFIIAQYYYYGTCEPEGAEGGQQTERV